MRTIRCKILLLIADGAPHDEATLEANGHEYLERHLREIAHRLERDGDVQWAAIGIGQQMGAPFRRVVTTEGLEQLGEALLHQLLSLFDPKSP